MLPLLRQPELQNGDRTSRDEFIRLWEQIPELKHAELIEGVVYLASPVSVAHGSYHSLLDSWLAHYTYSANQNFAITSDTTLLLGDSSFQPDLALFRTPNINSPRSKYLERVPDLVVEISYSSRSYDLGVKLAAYRSAGLREYVTVLLEEQRVEWRALTRSHYKLLEATQDGILRSAHFHGLWLDTNALFPPDRNRLYAAIDRGLS